MGGGTDRLEGKVGPVELGLRRMGKGESRWRGGMVQS